MKLNDSNCTSNTFLLVYIIKESDILSFNELNILMQTNGSFLCNQNIKYASQLTTWDGAMGV